MASLTFEVKKINKVGPALFKWIAYNVKFYISIMRCMRCGTKMCWRNVIKCVSFVSRNGIEAKQLWSRNLKGSEVVFAMFKVNANVVGGERKVKNKINQTRKFDIKVTYLRKWWGWRQSPSCWNDSTFLTGKMLESDQNI